METLRAAAVMAALCLISAHSKKQASDFFKICKRNDPDISSCFKEVLEDLRPKLVRGIPELNLVPLEPLVIPRMEYQEGTGNFRFRQVLTNLSIHGLGAYKVQDVKVDMKSLTFDISLRTPSMRFTSYYEIDGKILLLPIRGDGDCQFNFTDVTTVAHVKSKLVSRGGEEYVEVEDIRWDIAVTDARFKFNNLFNGDQALGRATNQFLNENWREAFNTYKYLPEEAFGVLFKDFTSSVYKTFTFKELFPE